MAVGPSPGVPQSPPKPSNQTGQTTDPELLKIAERHRFALAMFVVGVFATVLIFSLNPSYNTQPSVVISAFSGWIAAVFAFYFQGQNVDAANKNAADAQATAKKAKVDAKKAVDAADKKISDCAKLRASLRSGDQRMAEAMAATAATDDWDEIYRTTLDSLM